MALGVIQDHGVSPVSGVHAYTYTNAASGLVDLTLEIGFNPAKIEVANFTTSELHTKYKGMAANSSFLRALIGGTTKSTTQLLWTEGTAIGVGGTLTVESAAMALNEVLHITITP